MGATGGQESVEPGHCGLDGEKNASITVDGKFPGTAGRTASNLRGAQILRKHSIVVLLRLHVVRKSGLRSPQKAVFSVVRVDVGHDDHFSRLTRRV